MKKYIKSILFAVPGAESTVKAIKGKWRLEWNRISFYASDYLTDRRHLGWRRRGNDYWRLSSELVYWYHKLEKGLCLPPAARRFYGVDAARETCRLVKEWENSTFDRNHAILKAAIEALRAWRDRLNDVPPPSGEHKALIEQVARLLEDYAIDSRYSTPILSKSVDSSAFAHLRDLLEARRSTRDFEPDPVPEQQLEAAISAAQLSPSACNRQPWRLHFYRQPADVKAMLRLQNGNAGFGHTVPLLAVLTSDLGTFFDSTERMEPALDGGLFLMSFVLALQAQGLSSCCLNWCVDPEVDAQGHEIGQIPSDERILTFLAIGKSSPNSTVPRSARRPLQDVFISHNSLSQPTGQ